MKYIITNAFSLNMLKPEQVDLGFSPMAMEDVRYLLHIVEWESAIGHLDTAAVISNLLLVDIPMNRVNVQFDPLNMSLIVAQYTGPRLPEGSTQLPEGASISFWNVYGI